MNKEIVEHQDPMKAFQEKVVDKLRGDIGEMLPDNALNKLVERAVEEQFFKPVSVKIQGNFGSRTTEEKPSWFMREVTEQVKPLIEKAAAVYVEEHKDEIQAGIDKFISEQNLTILTMGLLLRQNDFTVQNAIGNAFNQLTNNTNQY